MNEPWSTLLSSRPGPAALPSVDRVLGLSALAPLLARHGRESVQGSVRALIDEKRQAILAGHAPEAVWAPGDAWIASELAVRLEAASRPRLRPVFNLTGTVLHTNLGRALMAEEAVEAVAQAMRWPVTLEYDAATGGRGERDELVELLICELTGAEAATVVNNCAAAVLLMLHALARRREVIVSRGELIEIGGAFRMPDIMSRAGCKLVEVGTTNRTHLRDYEQAIGPITAMLMKVHASNYAVEGFTAAVDERELAGLAQRRGLPFVVDLGSGSLVDLTQWGLPPEPTPGHSIAAGADLVAFSGDKLRGDRFVLRDQSALRTIGGGWVVDPFPPQRGRRGPARLACLRALALPDPRAALTGLLDLSPAGVDLARLATAWNLRPEEMAAVTRDLPVRTLQSGHSQIGYSERGWGELKQRVLAALDEEHRRAPDLIGIGRERLRRLADPSLPVEALTAALSELSASGELAQTGSWLHRPGHRVRLTATEEQLWQQVAPLLEQTPFHPPRVRDLAKALQVDESAMRQLLKSASRLGEVYPVAHDHYFTRRAVGQLAQIVRALEASDAGAQAAAFRDRIDTGRKLAIQILEFFDRIGFTRRVGDNHRLRQPDMFGQEGGVPVQ